MLTAHQPHIGIMVERSGYLVSSQSIARRRLRPLARLGASYGSFEAGPIRPPMRISTVNHSSLVVKATPFVITGGNDYVGRPEGR